MSAIVSPPPNTVVVIADRSMGTVTLSDKSIVAVPGGAVGPRGKPGRDGADGGSIVSVVAATILGGHRIVTTDGEGKAIYADCLTLSHAPKVLGMTLGAAIAGADVRVMHSGEVTEPSWAWDTDKPVFLANDGGLTQTVPTSGFSLIVGIPMTAVKLFVSIREPFILA